MNKRKRSKICLSLMLFSFFLVTISLNAFAAVKPAKVTSVKVTANGTSHKISWKKLSNVAGYEIWCKDCSNSANLFKKVKTAAGTKKSVNVTSRKVGKAYAYRVRAYVTGESGKMVYGSFSEISYGFSQLEQVPSTPQEPAVPEEPTTPEEAAPSSNKIIVNPTTAQKYKLVFGDASLNMWYPGGYYKSQAKAEKHMKSITVKTWDFASGKSGPKITRTWTIKVHKKLAPVVQQIFKEIYNGKEQFPIHELGGYAWRGGHSEHNTGTAIDINWTENYMITNGVIQAGSFWKPGKDPYSIPTDGEVAKIFNKYGFAQGDWGNSKDYMHFSYFET